MNLDPESIDVTTDTLSADMQNYSFFSINVITNIFNMQTYGNLLPQNMEEKTLKKKVQYTLVNTIQHYSSAASFSTAKGSSTSRAPELTMTTSFSGLSLASVLLLSILRTTFWKIAETYLK